MIAVAATSLTLMNTFANLEPKVAKLFRLVQYYKALELQGPDQDFTANVEPQIVSLMTLIQNYKAANTDDAEQQCRAVDKYEALNRYNKELDEGNWIAYKQRWLKHISGEMEEQHILEKELRGELAEAEYKAKKELLELSFASPEYDYEEIVRGGETFMSISRKDRPNRYRYRKQPSTDNKQ